MYEVTVKKIESNHKNLDIEEVTGDIISIPKVGEALQVFSDALEFDGGQPIIATTKIKEVRKVENELVIQTANSTYVLSNIVPIDDLFEEELI